MTKDDAPSRSEEGGVFGERCKDQCVACLPCSIFILCLVAFTILYVHVMNVHENTPPSGFTIPTQVGHVTVSTRSEPLGTLLVDRELGLVFGSCKPYAAGEPQEKLNDAIHTMVAEAERLGANAVLAVHVAVRDDNKFIVYGTACHVAPR